MPSSKRKSPPFLEFKNAFDRAFNDALFDQFIAATSKHEQENTQVKTSTIKRSHFFHGRHENIYLDESVAPNLTLLKADAKQRAQHILGAPISKMGCWFNAMPSGASTTLHKHDEEDEKLSGVYYLRVPENSGNLIIHQEPEKLQITPQAGQWVFFAPNIAHEVSENFSSKVRLSVAFNFS